MATKDKQVKDIVFYTQNTTTYAWIKRGKIGPDGIFHGDERFGADVVESVVKQHELDLTKPFDREKFCFYASGSYAMAVEESMV